jgi:hypothetical protein
MPLVPAFIRVAERSLSAAEAALTRAVHEKAGFLGYHAFESAGGAYCTSRNVQFHPANHPEKMRRFVVACRHERFALKAAALAAEIVALRNALLYPRRLADNHVVRPEQVISEAQVRRLLGRITRLVDDVRQSV